MLSIIVEMGCPIPSCVSLLIEEQPIVKTNNGKITSLTSNDFIQVTLSLLVKDPLEAQGSPSFLFFIFLQSLIDHPPDDL